MLARLATVVEDVRVGAAGVFESVGQDGQAVESSLIVDGAGDLGCVDVDARHFDGRDAQAGPKANDVTEQGRQMNSSAKPLSRVKFVRRIGTGSMARTGSMTPDAWALT